MTSLAFTTSTLTKQYKKDQALTLQVTVLKAEQDKVIKEMNEMHNQMTELDAEISKTGTAIDKEIQEQRELFQAMDQQIQKNQEKVAKMTEISDIWKSEIAETLARNEAERQASLKEEQENEKTEKEARGGVRLRDEPSTLTDEQIYEYAREIFPGWNEAFKGVDIGVRMVQGDELREWVNESLNR